MRRSQCSAYGSAFVAVNIGSCTRRPRRRASIIARNDQPVHKTVARLVAQPFHSSCEAVVIGRTLINSVTNS